jgi:hypothetical protein
MPSKPQSPFKWTRLQFSDCKPTSIWRAKDRATETIVGSVLRHDEDHDGVKWEARVWTGFSPASIGYFSRLTEAKKAVISAALGVRLGHVLKGTNAEVNHGE